MRCSATHAIAAKSNSSMTTGYRIKRRRMISPFVRCSLEMGLYLTCIKNELWFPGMGNVHTLAGAG
jgi:hypothetical protein